MLMDNYINKNYIKKKLSSRCGAMETKPTSIHEGEGLIPEWVGDQRVRDLTP